MKILYLIIVALLSFGECFHTYAKDETTYSVSVCSIFKDEAPWLKEWIEFHKIQGVQHFYLYNNNSSDNFKEVLKPYLKNGDITLVDWNFKYTDGATGAWLAIQKNAYTHCIKEFGPQTQWLAIIDTDEFLFCPDGEKLPQLLSSYTEYGALCVNWLFFGTSNIKEIPKNSLMIELLTYCSKSPHLRDHNVKSIVQPKYVSRVRNPHVCIFKENIKSVTVDKNEFQDIIRSKEILLDKIRINHYWTRTEKFFNENKIESRHSRRSGESNNGLIKRAKSYNKVEDKAIFPFIKELKQKMGFNNNNSLTPINS